MGKKKILIIDDEVDLLEMVRMRLEANGYNIIIAQDGQEGLEKAQNERPDLILCDVMMPRKDGYEVCSTLKTDERYSKIPLILFTAKAQKDDAEIGQEVGADAYVTKPFESLILINKIEELLNKPS